MGMSVGGWIFSVELRERPSTKATHMNVLAPIPFLRSYGSVLFVMVVLWEGGGVSGEFGSSLSKSPGGVHGVKLDPGRRCNHQVLKSIGLKVAAGSREGGVTTSESPTQPNPTPSHPHPTFNHI